MNDDKGTPKRKKITMDEQAGFDHVEALDPQTLRRLVEQDAAEREQEQGMAA